MTFEAQCATLANAVFSDLTVLTIYAGPLERATSHAATVLARSRQFGVYGAGQTMLSKLKSVISRLLPVRLHEYLVARRRGFRFVGPVSDWEEAHAASRGYNDDAILRHVVEASHKVSRGEAAYERDGVAFETPVYVWPALSGLLLAAALNGGRLSVLDFGGSLGSTFFQHRAFLDLLPEVRWTVVEQPLFVRGGLEHISHPALDFYTTIQEAMQSAEYNAVLLSSVLQYVEHPYEVLEDMNGVEADVLIIDRTPFNRRGGSLICVQHVSGHFADSSYPVHIFDPAEFDRVLKRSWTEVATFPSLVDPPMVPVGRHQVEFLGGVYVRNSDQLPHAAGSKGRP